MVVRYPPRVSDQNGQRFKTRCQHQCHEGTPEMAIYLEHYPIWEQPRNEAIFHPWETKLYELQDRDEDRDVVEMDGASATRLNLVCDFRDQRR